MALKNEQNVVAQLGMAAIVMGQSPSYCEYPIICIPLWIEPAIRHEALRQYYQEQQRNKTKYQFGHTTTKSSDGVQAWLYAALVGESPSLGSRETELISRIDRIVTSLGESFRYVSWWTGARLLRPRESLERKSLLEKLSLLVPKASDRCGASPGKVEAFIRDCVGQARRHWTRLPCGLAVHAHAVSGGSSALRCSTRDGQSLVWIEGPVGPNNQLTLFDRSFIPHPTEESRIARSETQWSMLCHADFGTDLSSRALLKCGHIDLPYMRVVYSRPTVLKS